MERRARLLEDKFEKDPLWDSDVLVYNMGKLVQQYLEKYDMVTSGKIYFYNFLVINYI